MLNELEDKLVSLLENDLGYTVNPVERAVNDLPEEIFPICFIDYGEEEADSPENVPNGYYQNFMPMVLTIVLYEKHENLRRAANVELSRLKKFIDQHRCYAEAVIDLIYVGSDVLAIGSELPAGALQFTFELYYRQKRSDPDSI